jgi:hypothetical protein
MTQRRGGLIRVTTAGIQQDCLGDATYNLGVPKRTAVLKADGRPGGYTEEGQVPFIEVDVLDRPDLDLKAFLGVSDATVTVDLANGKSVVLSHAWYAGEGTGESKNGSVKSRWEGLEAVEINP